jgi:DNA-binding response OmpR family regulator
MSRVVIFDGEKQLCVDAAGFLADRDFEVSFMDGCDELLALAGAADMAVLDTDLPDGAGLDLIRSLRGRYPHIGIIAQGSCAGIEGKLQGLYAGADHFLLKPVELPELLAVLEALARRVGGACAWQLKLSRRLLQAPEGQQSILSVPELTIFRLFAANAGEVVSRRQIVEAMGHSWLDYDLRRLDTLISRLRRRWREQLGLELPLRTEHRDGYSFCAPLRCTH